MLSTSIGSCRGTTACRERERNVTQKKSDIIPSNGASSQMPTAGAPGMNGGSIIQKRSIQWPIMRRMQTLTSSPSLSFVHFGRRITKGIAQLNNTFTIVKMSQLPSSRRTKYVTSSGILAYQMRRYWLNQMYIQNVENAKISLPRL